MRFDDRTVGFLLLDPAAPELPDEERDRLQDAHLAHLAALHDAGDILAAGPLPGPDDRDLRGLIVYGCDPDRARALGATDPMVLAGRFRHEVHSWLVPAGLLHFSPGRMPRSSADVAE